MRACSCPLGWFERDVHARPSVCLSACVQFRLIFKGKGKMCYQCMSSNVSLHVHTVCAVTFQGETETLLDCDTLNVREINILNNR